MMISLNCRLPGCRLHNSGSFYNSVVNYFKKILLLIYQRQVLMPEKNLIIHHEVGLHARPASIFVKTAAKFKSEITVSHGDRTSNAKSILGILSLGAQKDAKISIKAEGDDAADALKALETLVNDNFGEG
jgi:phosphotransferase system HPr (HPr) family protein